MNNIFGNVSDLISAHIYAVDTDDFTVIHSNKFNNKENLKCWEVIYGYEQKCPFCKIDELKQNQKDNNNKLVKFEVFNELLNEWYQPSEKLTKEDGKLIKYSAGTNITELKSTQNDLTQTYAELMIQKREIEIFNKTLEKRVSEEIKKNEAAQQEIFQKSKAAAMGEMIGTIAHQIKQPISVINILADSTILNEQLGIENDLEETANNIKDQTQFMTDTIDLFRNFFNPNKVREDILVDELFDQTLKIFKDLAVGIKILKNYNDDGKQITVYPNELIQVFMNIIKNAKDVFEEKNIQNRYITLSCYVDDENNKVLEILDNAGGIPDDIKEKIFDRYFSTKGEEKGTGIGLDLARVIIEDKHQGKISVENYTYDINGEEFTGAKFIMKLPILKF